jgi:hypothetical protein
MSMLLQQRTTAAALGAALALAPLGAFAQTAGPETVHGTIASYDGASNLTLNDDRGFVDTIHVDPQTAVNANGTQLRPGMTVTIVGVNRGNALAATEIDVEGAPEPQPPSAAQPLPDAPPGTAMHATSASGYIDASIDSGSAFVGQRVRLVDVTSPGGEIAHATALGEVVAVTPAGQGRNAQIALHFDTLRLPDGSTVPIDGNVEHMQVNTKSNAGKEAGGALLGMLAGNALAKTLFGLSGGGLIGAVGGFLVAKDNRSNVVIPAQSLVTLSVAPPRRQAL